MAPRALSWILLALLYSCRSTPPPVVVEAPVPAVSKIERFADLESDAPVEILEEEARYVFDHSGTKRYTYRIVYRILSEEDLDKWSTVIAEWSPWYQERPEIDAVVTDVNGTKHRLDPSTIKEEAAGEQPETDHRRLRARLPAAEVGAVVDRTIVYPGKKPFFKAGSVNRFYFGMRAPVAQSRLVIDVPASGHLTYETRAITLTPFEERSAGRRSVTFEVSRMPPLKPVEELLPYDAPRLPHVVFSTAPSWRAVASEYGQIVEEQLKGQSVAPVVAGIKEGATREEKIAEIITRLHRKIRYTGLKFGDQAIIPSTPSETLARRYGDCKDKAVLLVAMLRAVGIEAQVALIRAGTGADIAPRQPGLENFNHAIVLVPGQKTAGEIWIDASAEYTALGELPSTVQDRHVLIASPDSTGLMRTPAPKSSDNHYLETRDIFMNDWGPVRIVESTRATGVIEQRIRAMFDRPTVHEVKDSLVKYVESQYRAAELSDFRFSSPRDLTEPLSISIEASDARIGNTTAQDGVVQLRTAVIFSWLPDQIRFIALPREDPKEEARRADLLAHRESDLLFPTPFVAEVRFRIVPPDGYTLRELPPSDQLPLGPALFQSTYSKDPDGTIRATFRFDLGKSRYSADEARALTDGLRTLWNRNIPKLDFDHRGARYLAQGRVREGLAEYRGLVAQHPDEALHHARLAEALLHAGLGDPARAESLKAIEISPEDGYAQFARGWVLQHDLFGRKHHKGFDRDGAIEAYREAIKIDPQNEEARMNLAVLLEHDESGNRFRKRAGVLEAIEEYRTARDAGNKGFDENLLVALYWAEQFEEIKRLASTMKQGPLRDSMLLTAICATDGVDAALRAARKLGLPQKALQSLYQLVSSSLAHIRFYPEARAVAEVAAKGASDPVSIQSRLALLTKIQRFEDGRLPDSKPAAVVQKLLAVMLTGGASEALIKEIFSSQVFETSSPRQELDALSEAFEGFRRMARKSGIPLEMLRDNIIAVTRLSTEGSDAEGFRIRAQVVSPAGQRTGWWFIILEHGKYRLRASEADPSDLGHEALLRLSRNDLRGARRWLDWARELVTVNRSRDPLTSSPFIELWTASRKRDKNEIRIAAAALAASGRGSKRVTVILKKALTKNKSSTLLRLALALGYENNRNFVALLPHAAALLQEHPTSAVAYHLRYHSLRSLGRNEEARKLATARLRLLGDDGLSMSHLADIAGAEGEFEEAERLLQSIIGSGNAVSSTYNNLAWLALFRGKVLERDVEMSLHANNMTRFESASSLHTLAALYADRGMTQKAFQLMLQRMDLRNASEPQDVDWFLIGRIMEQYDLDGLAEKAYRKVEKPDHDRADSTYALAQSRLALLRLKGKTAI